MTMFKKYLGKFNDWALCLVLIPLINTINYHLTYSKITWDWYTYTTYFIDTATGFICWWLIRKTIDYLDKKIPYEEALGKRLMIQLISTTLIVQGFIILSTESINFLFGEGPIPIEFYTYNLFIFFIWILVLNGIYIGIYFYVEWKNTKLLREKDKELRQKGFEVLFGKTIKNIDFENISLFYVADGITYLKTNQNRDYSLDISLNQIKLKLPEELFFRINRKFIINRHFILGYKKEINGKLLVNLDKGQIEMQDQIISRITAPEFKRWFSTPALHN
ncbi:LytTR family DNA-binding domain-containing protein [Croceitalea rosinachiae]|uniref:LytTR family DNA-binding domain-containing protein n=1 Tax=Croceitalea rosinachiae TaxID=3075596 RepID=A0ABU3AEL7_9FLAO|nr:LytTR family DNA-binding domain-containing protein [Croceitalea sp. F388]MDT0607967.1 LytTR family DNA-binding domain-containing protein [Croceitalea sp. F388]